MKPIWLHALVKLLFSSAFVAFALWKGALESPYGIVVLVALGFSWLGDLFLVPQTSAFFLSGLFSFLLAHLAFGAAFLLKRIDLLWAGSAIPVVVIVGLGIGRWLIPSVRTKNPKMFRPVLAYLVVISTMVTLAAGAAGSSRNFWILIGAVAFYGSDISVAREKFIEKSLANKAWGLPLYYAAQFILAGTVVG